MIIKKKKEGRKEVEKGEKNANEGLHSVNFRFEFWTGKTDHFAISGQLPISESPGSGLLQQ